MITKAIKLLLLVYAALCVPAFAGSQTGQVSKVVIRASDGLVYFFMDGPSTARPACVSNMLYWMIRDENSTAGKRQLAALLAARASGQVITVRGSDTCNRWYNGEDVDSIEM